MDPVYRECMIKLHAHPILCPSSTLLFSFDGQDSHFTITRWELRHSEMGSLPLPDGPPPGDRKLRDLEGEGGSEDKRKREGRRRGGFLSHWRKTTPAANLGSTWEFLKEFQEKLLVIFKYLNRRMHIYWGVQLFRALLAHIQAWDTVLTTLKLRNLAQRPSAGKWDSKPSALSVPYIVSNSLVSLRSFYTNVNSDFFF